MNETFFATLSATMQAAIVPKAINQDMWNSTTNVKPTSGTYYYIKFDGYTSYYTDSNYGVANVGNRNIYALSVRDIIDYLSVPTNGEFFKTDVWEMLWNTESANNKHLWLCSAMYDSSNHAFYVNGNSGVLSVNYYNASYRVRPVFQIDLSKIAYTKN